MRVEKRLLLCHDGKSFYRISLVKWGFAYVELAADEFFMWWRGPLDHNYSGKTNPGME